MTTEIGPPMSMTLHNTLRASAMASLLTLLAACGGNDNAQTNSSTPIVPDDSVTCGDGTVKQGTMCVIEVPIECGEGTSLVEGQCVPDPVDAPCGEGTTLVAGECVPDATTLCGAGTSLDTASGRCIAQSECSPDTVLIDGVCSSKDEVALLDPDITESTEQNDVARGGDPELIATPEVGQSVSAIGNIDAPTDFDADGQEDQDLDTWRLNVNAGDALRIHLQDAGAGALGFEITGPEGFSRQGPRHAPEPSRTIYFPYDGIYDLTVMPQAKLYDRDAGPSGSESSGYRLVVENLGGLDTAQGTPVELGATMQASGSFNALESNLYKFEYTAPMIWRSTLSSYAAGVTPALMLLDAQANLVRALPVGQDTVLTSSDVDSGTWLLVDHVALGSDIATYQIDFDVLNATSADATLDAGASASVSDALTIAPNQSAYINLDVSASDPLVIEASLNTDADLDTYTVEFISPAGDVISSTSSASPVFLSQTSGKHLLKITNTSTNATHTISSIALQGVEPEQLGALTMAGQTANASVDVGVGATAYLLYSNQDPVSATFQLTSQSNQQLSFSALDQDFVPLLSTQGDDALVLDGVVMTDAGSHLVTVRNLGDASASAQVTVLVNPTPTLETEPNNRLANASVLDISNPVSIAGTLTESDTDLFMFSSNQTALITATLLQLDGDSSVEVSILNSTGEVIETSTPGFAETFTAAVATQIETYYVRVRSTDGSTSRYALNVSADPTGAFESEPNDDSSSAEMLALSQPVTGSVQGIQDYDWYAIDVAAETLVSIDLRKAAGAQLPPSQNLRAFAFGADAMTTIDGNNLLQLPAGRSYIQVLSVANFGSGNTYELEVTEVSAQDLGQLSSDTEFTREGTFSQASTGALFSFELASDLPADNSKAVVVWSSAPVDVFDAQGQALHISADTGQVFGTAAEPSFASSTLAAGTYRVAIRDGAVGQDWQLYVGYIDNVEETEPNDSRMAPEDLGGISTGQTIYRTGDVDAADFQDVFKITPTTDGTLHIDQFQTGEGVADLDLFVILGIGIPGGQATNHPHTISMPVTAGTEYFIEARFVEDISMMSSGGYVLRAELE